MKQIILATASQGRLKWFRQLGIEFISENSDIDEYFEGRPTDPRRLVKLLAKRKALSVAKKHADGIVIGFDSVGYLDGKIIEKPKDKEDAFNMLKNLSGRTHEFITGVFIIDIETKKKLATVTKIKNTFRELSDDEIRFYIEQEPNITRYAGAYDLLSYSSVSFFKKVNGNLTTLFGIPIDVIIGLLKKLGYDYTKQGVKL